MFRHHVFPRIMTELQIWQSFGAAPQPPLSRVGTKDIIYLIHTVMLLYYYVYWLCEQNNNINMVQI